MDKENATIENTNAEISNEIVKTLDAAFGLLSAIPVSGDYVDIMAEARRKLRHAYHLAKESRVDGR